MADVRAFYRNLWDKTIYEVNTELSILKPQWKPFARSSVTQRDKRNVVFRASAGEPDMKAMKDMKVDPNEWLTQELHTQIMRNQEQFVTMALEDLLFGKGGTPGVSRQSGKK